MSHSARETFAAHQDSTKFIREKIVKALGLPEGSEDFFQVFTKKNESDTSEGHAGMEELKVIQGLSLVHHVEPEDGRPVPTAVVNAARGTVLYNYKGIVIKPIPSPDNLLMDRISSQDGFVTLSGLLGTVRLSMDTVRFREYHLGTLMRLVKVNGEMTWFTAKNIIPGGAYHGKERLHKMSKRGHAKPFLESVREIAACTDPSLNDDANHLWFPAGTLFSRWEYRFVLCTRDHSTYQSEYTPANGYMLFIGAFANWDRKLPEGITADIAGVRHEKPYDPAYPTSPPTDNRDDSYILKSSHISLKEANAVLAGNTDVDPRLSGGGKLIVTGENSSGIPLTYHVVSPGWAHRERTLGNNPSLYAGFLDCLDKQDYDISKPADKRAFLELFPLLCLPGTGPNDCGTMAEVLKLVKTHSYLPSTMLPPEDADSQIYSRDIRMIWYNFLLCSNVSVRVMVYWFLTRYLWELDRAAEYIVALNDKFIGDVELKDRLWDAKKQILKKGGKMTKNGVVAYLKEHRQFARKVVHAILKYGGLKEEAIRIAEPDAVFHKKEETYSTIVCKNTGRK